jgi:hypothetical protein
MRATPQSWHFGALSDPAPDVSRLFEGRPQLAPASNAPSVFLEENDGQTAAYILDERR